jgi:hypothetical protein
MVPRFRALLALVLVASSNAACGGGGASPGGGGGSGTATDQEPPDQAGMTAAHNAARAAVNPAASPALPPLTWDPTVAAYAQAYSEKCTWKHSMGPYGENIYASFGMNPTPADVVTAWVSEVADYDYASNTCSPSGAIPECGHYTQVVWRDSLRLGCGMTKCTTGSPFGANTEPWLFWVCDYDPPGNIVGDKPY